VSGTLKANSAATKKLKKVNRNDLVVSAKLY
jgi:hypothetical protein